MFMETIHVPLSAAKWRLALVYPIDNFVFFRSAAEQINHVYNEFMLSHKANITLKLATFYLSAENIDRLEYVI